ncbi:Flavin reductase like domain protein [Limihaloglobus sulfuriphilus]|uniref:Flavin reductase like domain protein n=1 Tax=Limihaloglobus sulfuriphilus TaxID=1851148 RepID=A0A1Q2MBX1_9BACT|nr:flavin reductase family protein [Limihaloglobus sulfuriphilus]AQQ70159.1 Flavin reductase like domain protein [Limihaloglobus sulfuriphilus]
MFKNVEGPEAIRFLSTKPTMIITTLHENAKVNAGVFGAYTNLSRQHVGIAVYTESDTNRNILRDKEFTINIPSADLVKKIKILAENLPPGISEVEKAGLTLKDPLTNKVPSIAECAAAVECRLDKVVPVSSHDFFIGEVTGGWIKQDFVTDKGRLDVFKSRVFKDFCYPEPYYVLAGEIIEG